MDPFDPPDRPRARAVWIAVIAVAITLAALSGMWPWRLAWPQASTGGSTVGVASE